jgi:hypothetical protein
MWARRLEMQRLTASFLDGEHLHRYKERRYLIYIKGEDGIMLWKAVESAPVLLEFDCNF